jgi:hypothetical protein
MRSGRSFESVAQSSPQRAVVPALKDSTTTSAVAMSRRAISRASGLARSSATDRLPAL